MKRLIALCWFFLLSLSVATESGTYTIRVDGKPLELNYGSDAQPSPGQIIYIQRIPLCLDEPGHYEFQVKDGVIFRKLADGKLIPKACKIGPKFDESLPIEQRFRKQPTVSNPLSQWTDEELKSLRGVFVNAWSEEVQTQLAKLDLERVCLYLDEDVLKAHQGLPQIPEDVRTLILDLSNHFSGEMNMSRLATFKKLRHLELQNLDAPDFDFAVLKGLPLQYLSLPTMQSVKNTEVLGTLTALKTLVANRISYMGDGRWIANLHQLESLYASYLYPSTEGGPPVELDLSALSSLSQLRLIQAQRITLKSLPSTAMPQLKRASFLLSEIPEESLAAFTQANPQTNFETKLNSTLAKQLEKADRILVRTGGLCHRNEKEEVKIHETRDATEIKELIGNTVVVEGDCGHCMCCGDPSFEYYQGDKLIAMLGFHHGRTLRWSGGAWPEDAALSQQSSKYLVEWLAKHGYDDPKNELLEQQRQQAAAQRRVARLDALLPEDVNSDLIKLSEDMRANRIPSGEGVWEEKATAIFETNVKDDKKRATLCLSIFGCEDSTWAVRVGIESTLIDSLLPRIPKDTLHAVILAAPIPSEEALGAVRWMFGEAKAADFQDSPEAFQKLTQFALTHPRQSNRWRTLTVLRDLGTPQARSILRSVMKDGTTPRQLSEEEMTEPGGMMSFYPGDIGLPESTPDTAAAALCLAQLKDTESETHIQKIRETLPAEAKKKWDETLNRK